MGKPQKRNEILSNLAVALYREMGSAIKVASRLGVSPQTVYRMLRDAGVHVPGHKEEKPNRRKFSPETEESVVADYLAGMSLTALEAKYGKGQYAIRAAVKRAGHRLRDHGAQRRRVTQEEGARMAFLYEVEKLSQAQIGAIFKAGQTVVGKVLRERGVKINGRERAGDKSVNWRGGISKNAQGYILENCVDDPICKSMATRSGYAMQHRIVMARHLGRPLHKSETVHHINGDKTDNRVENLQLRHGRHGHGEVLVCANCGSHNIIHREIS